MNTEYWIAGLQDALEQVGAGDALTAEQISKAGAILAGGASVESEATGVIERTRPSAAALDTERQRIERARALGRDFGKRGLPLSNVHLPTYPENSLEEIALRLGHMEGIQAWRRGRGNYDPLRSAI